MNPDKRLREWLLWKVCLPFIFIAAMWPVGCAMRRSDAYERAFAHGEFLIFGAFVLLEAALEMKHSAPDDDWWPDLARVAGIVVVFCYGFVYVLVVQAEEKPTFKHDLVYYAYFSCSVAIAALSVSVYSYWRAKGGAASRQLPQE
jgi:hypothetical protein